MGYLPADDVRNLDRVRGVPYAVAGLFAAVGLLGVALALISSVRSGQEELAVLKALGLVRRQVYAVVTWQALTHGVFALLLGIPAGIAVGRWVWHVLALEVQAAVTPVSPGPILALVGLGTLAAVITVAAMPAIAAATAPPTAMLRTE
jgi:ABC-type antimicrobial peptide transport system permease subunit